MPIQQRLQSLCENTPRGLGEITSRLKHYRIWVNRGTLSKNTYNSFLKPSTLVAEINVRLASGREVSCGADLDLSHPTGIHVLVPTSFSVQVNCRNVSSPTKFNRRRARRGREAKEMETLARYGSSDDLTCRLRLATSHVPLTYLPVTLP